MQSKYGILNDVVQNVDGWLSLKEAGFLYNAALEMAPKGEIVEIGSWKGKSTICIALALSGTQKIHAIDHHIGSKECGLVNSLPEMKSNLKKYGVSKKVNILAMKSDDAAKIWAKGGKKISFLWIDASHEYEDVKKDFLIWSKYLVNGGIIAFHDTFFRDGPKRVVDEFIFRGGFSGIGFVDEITYARKVPGSPASMKRLERNLILARRKYGPARIREFLSRKVI